MFFFDSKTFIKKKELCELKLKMVWTCNNICSNHKYIYIFNELNQPNSDVVSSKFSKPKLS